MYAQLVMSFFDSSKLVMKFSVEVMANKNEP